MHDEKRVCAILLAAGSSTRMGAGENKLLMHLCGRTPIELAALAFGKVVDEIIFAVSPATESEAGRVSKLIKISAKTVMGGARRQDSVINALKKTNADIVAIHDCARCLVTTDVIRKSISSAIDLGSGVASLPVVDTLRRRADNLTVNRDEFIAAQTPQSFSRALLLAAYDKIDEKQEYTDDAAVFAAAGHTLHYTEGDRLNIKLTTPQDVPFFNLCLKMRMSEAAKEI